MSIFTVSGEDGGSFSDVQPVAGSVTGSPFTVTSTPALPTPALTGLALVHAAEIMHVRVSKDGTAATVNDMVLPAGEIHRIPVDGDILSFIAASTTGAVHVEMAKELSS